MFILNIIKTVPILFIINVYANTTDSSLVYYNLGLENAKTSTFERSEFYFKKAIDFSKDSGLTANYLNDLGIVFKLQSKYKLALNSYKNAEIYTKNSELLSKIYLNRGVIKKITGDYEKALLLYNKALKLTHIEKQKSFTFNNIANIYYQQEKYNKALEYYTKSYNLMKTITHEDFNYVYANIALCYQELSDKKEAAEYFLKTINELKKFHRTKYNLFIPTYLNYGSFLKDTDPEKSYNLLIKANNLALNYYGEKHPETAKTYLYLGNYYNSRKEYNKALEQYQKALIANSRQFNNLDFYQNPPKTDVISELERLEILHKKAITFQKYAHISSSKQKELKTSLKTYELAVATLFKLQNSFMDESKRTLISNKKDMFAEAANVAIQLKDYPKAFQLIEKGKASTLLATINNNQAIKFSNIPDSLVELENEYKRLQFVHSANENIDSILYYQSKYNSLITYFENHYPKYHKLKYSSMLVNPCQYLDTNQVLLEYSLTDTLCITLIITKEGYRHYSFPVDSVFYNYAETFIYRLKDYIKHELYREQYQQITFIGYYLWEKLIKPLNISEGKSLLIIPDGILSYIPFDAMLYEPPPESKRQYYFNLNYLVYKHPISYSYSAKWLFEPFTCKPSKNIGAFALDYREKDSMMLLLNTIPIAKKITRYFQGRAFINEDCKKNMFINHAGKFKVLHLGMHGDIVSKNKIGSKLIFDDDDLYSWEVYGMNLNARLAYLSACNTGDGELDKGEGIFSMGRAFAYAGCVSLVTSLWAEKDNLPGITLDFYKYIQKEYPLDVALQQAKINHIKAKHRTHPHYWANKILMGKTMPIQNQSKYWLLIIFAGIIILIAILVIKLFQ